MHVNIGEKSKERILTAAIDEFIEYGYYGARMQRIADRARINKAMIHYYFSNKEKIYETVIKTVVEYLIGKLNAISDESAGTEKKMEEIMDAYISVFMNYSHYIKLVLYEVIRGGTKLYPIIKENFYKIPINSVNGKLYKYFKKEIKDGNIKNVNPIHIFISIVTQIAPVYFVKDIVERAAGILGFDRLLIKKFVKERKNFVLSLMKEGILKHKSGGSK